MKGLLLLLLTWFQLGAFQQASAAVGCSLANPDQDIARLFPEVTSYRVHFLSFKTQAPEGQKALEVGLGTPLDALFETDDTPYSLYIVDGKKGRLGYVFGANNRGAHSSIQLIGALDPSGSLLSLSLQRIRSPEAKAFRNEAFLNGLAQAGLEANYTPCYRDGLCEGLSAADPSQGRAKQDYQAILRGVTKLRLLKDLLLQPTRNPIPRSNKALAEWIGNYRGAELVAALPKELNPQVLTPEAYQPDDPVFVWGLGEYALVWPLGALAQHPLLEMQIGTQSLLLASASLSSNPVLLAPTTPKAFRSTRDVLFEEALFLDLHSGSQWSLSLGKSVYGPSANQRIRRGLGGLSLSWQDALNSGLKLVGSPPLSGSRKSPRKGELLVLQVGDRHPAWRITDLAPDGLLQQEGLVLARIGDDAVGWQHRDQTGQTHDLKRDGTLFAHDKATGSRWSLVSGRAMEGPLKGRQLQGLVHTRLQQSAWESLFPGQSLAPNRQ